MPFSERAAEDPQWHLQPAADALSFEADFGKFAVVFLPDHAAPDGSWYTTHGVVHGNKDAYPYTHEDYRALCAHIKALGKSVFTMSHYNFPGGNREAPLLEQMLPLPKNFVMHFYGHAHIGDTALAHGNARRKLAGIHNHALMQANISSLEEGRSTGARSAVLTYYDDGSAAVFFRNHSLRQVKAARQHQPHRCQHAVIPRQHRVPPGAMPCPADQVDHHKEHARAQGRRQGSIAPLFRRHIAPEHGQAIAPVHVTTPPQQRMPPPPHRGRRESPPRCQWP